MAGAASQLVLRVPNYPSPLPLIHSRKHHIFTLLLLILLLSVSRRAAHCLTIAVTDFHMFISSLYYLHFNHSECSQLVGLPLQL